MAPRDETDARQHYSERYGGAVLPATIAIEREVLGTDYGATGYSGRTQIDELADRLGLTGGDRLLDVGSGCGWPGLHLAGRSGCRVVVSDLPLAGMRRAADRAAADGLADRVAAVVASARHLPFRSGTFDAVVHVDVLCCMTAKVGALRESRRVLRAGGRLAFFAVVVAPGLDAARHRRAARAGPRAVVVRGGDATFRSLLHRTGFSDVVEEDVTPAYAEAARTVANLTGRYRDELRAADPAGYDQQLHDRRDIVKAVEAGLLRRSFLCATAT